MSNTSKITVHNDGTITYWSVYRQQWVREPAGDIPDNEIAAMSPEAQAQMLDILDHDEWRLRYQCAYYRWHVSL